ncbi:MAG TPA: hypothetical protein VMS45_10695 [Gemmatimonadaceae bacterium]|nr:hypothetical protein [Gemmatimonadaceae bacterium]
MENELRDIQGEWKAPRFLTPRQYLTAALIGLAAAGLIWLITRSVTEVGEALAFGLVMPLFGHRDTETIRGRVMWALYIVLVLSIGHWYAKRVGFAP